MTTKEQAIADDKMRAEIAKLIAESSNLNAATAQITKETNYYVLFRSIALGAALFGGATAAAKFFLVG